MAHSNDLCNIIDSMNPDIIVGVETKVDSAIHLGEILPKQYLENVVRVDRKRVGGGLIIAAKDDYICSEVTKLHTQCENGDCWLQTTLHLWLFQAQRRG